MRVSTSMMYQRAQRNIADRRLAVTEAQEQVSTGRALNRASDDPQAARRVLKAEELLVDIEGNRASLDRADHLLSVTDDTLADVTNLVQRIEEMAVQFANDTNGPQDRLLAAEELVQLRERTIELANSQDNGRYLFGGLGSAAAPFDAVGVFGGDTGRLEVTVGRGARVEATLPGGDPFVPAAGPSLFDTIDSLETALRADNAPAVSALVDEVRGHTERVRQSRQSIGHRFERIEYVREALERVEITATRTLEQDREADLTESVVQLRQAEVGLQSALLVTARLDELNLMNFI